MSISFLVIFEELWVLPVLHLIVHSFCPCSCGLNIVNFLFRGATFLYWFVLRFRLVQDSISVWFSLQFSSLINMIFLHHRFSEWCSISSRFDWKFCTLVVVIVHSHLHSIYGSFFFCELSAAYWLLFLN